MHGRASLRRPALAFVTLLTFSLVASGPPDSIAAPGAADYLIVTTRDLAPAFHRLAAAKSGHGRRAEIVTLEDIRQAGGPGRDDAERVRRTLQDARQAGVRAVSRLAVRRTESTRIDVELAFDAADAGAGFDVSVFDVSGRRVKEMARGRATGGQRQALSWSGETDGGGAAARGVYFVVLGIGDARESRRVVLARR